MIAFFIISSTNFTRDDGSSVISSIVSILSASTSNSLDNVGVTCVFNIPLISLSAAI